MISLDISIIQIHFFLKSNVKISEFLDFLDNLLCKFALKNWSHFFVMGRQAQNFEKHVSIINRICSHNEHEIDKFNEIAQEYFS